MSNRPDDHGDMVLALLFIRAKLQATKTQHRVRTMFGGISVHDESETREALNNPDGPEAVDTIDTLLAERAILIAERDDARALLEQLEGACETVCAQRNHEQYLAMIDLGQQPALLELDAARLAARAYLTKGTSDGR